MSSREKAVRRARRIITDQQLLEFFRTIRNESGILAVELICDHLEEGLSLDAIFYTGEDDGFSLSVKARGKTNFKITPGLPAGQLCAGCYPVTPGFLPHPTKLF